MLFSCHFVLIFFSLLEFIVAFKFFNCSSFNLVFSNQFYIRLNDFRSFINDRDDPTQNVIDLSCIKNLYDFGFSDPTIVDVESLDQNRILIYLNKSTNETPKKILINLFDMNKISYLMLKDLKLERLTRRMLFHLKKLENFQMERIKIKSVDSNLFDSVENLNSLTIHDGSFEAISILKLNETKSDFLVSLELECNGIKYLDQQSFSKLSNLKLLFLNGNNIELIQANTFKYLCGLTYLNLNQNKIVLIGDYAFAYLIKLESLIITDNKLEFVAVKAMDNLVNLKNLDLNKNQLRSISNIPINSFKLLRSLDLSENPFDQLDFIFKSNESTSIDCINRKKGFELSLSKLNTNKNIESISFGCFNNIEALRLDRNQLSWIEQTKTITILLNDLVNLKHFDINYFYMGSFKTFDLISNPKVKIESLKMSSHSIESIDFVEFKGFSGLKQLILNTNKITSIENVTLIGIESLESLSLSGNRLTSLKFVRFSGIPNLKSLDLSSNPIDTLTESRFEGIEKLETLLLYMCKIKSLEQVNFVGLRNLVELNFWFNPINPKSRRFTFKGIEKLEILDLSHIYLQSAENLEFVGIEQLKSLDLSHNDFMHENQVIHLKGLNKLKSLTLKRTLMALRSVNLTFIDLSETLEHLSLRENVFESLDRIELNGVDSLKYIDLTENSMIQLENPIKICCLLNKRNETNKQLIIDLDRNGVYQIRPRNFPPNTLVRISNTVLFSYTYLPFRMMYDISRQLNLFFTTYPSFIDLDLVNQNSHLFLRRKLRSLRFYQSIQIRLDNHQSIEINCSIVFAMYRKCSIARYLIGTQFQYDYFLDNCRMETLNPNQML